MYPQKKVSQTELKTMQNKVRRTSFEKPKVLDSMSHKKPDGQKLRHTLRWLIKTSWINREQIAKRCLANSPERRQ